MTAVELSSKSGWDVSLCERLLDGLQRLAGATIYVDEAIGAGYHPKLPSASSWMPWRVMRRSYDGLRVLASFRGRVDAEAMCANYRTELVREEAKRIMGVSVVSRGGYCDD